MLTESVSYLCIAILHLGMLIARILSRIVLVNALTDPSWCNESSPECSVSLSKRLKFAKITSASLICRHRSKLKLRRTVISIVLFLSKPIGVLLSNCRHFKFDCPSVSVFASSKITFNKWKEYPKNLTCSTSPCTLSFRIWRHFFACQFPKATTSDGTRSYRVPIFSSCCGFPRF